MLWNKFSIHKAYDKIYHKNLRAHESLYSTYDQYLFRYICSPPKINKTVIIIIKIFSV